MNNDCIEFRQGLADSSGIRDDLLCRHIEQCADCAAFLDARTTGTPRGLEQASWETVPAALGYNIISDILVVPENGLWRMILAGLSGLALAAAVFIFFIRAVPISEPSAVSPLMERISFLNSDEKSLSDYSFIDDAEDSIFVTDETDHASYKWTFLETSSHFTFIENDKEALWEDLSNG